MAYRTLRIVGRADPHPRRAYERASTRFTLGGGLLRTTGLRDDVQSLRVLRDLLVSYR